MKILRIKLRNLNSLRGDHEVNFEAEPLAGAGLFAITGPTGAGKSTLLDAITLALYGKAARYGPIPSPEDMMSRHCGDCMAEVVFQVPLGIYRAEWQLHRARAKADGKVQAPKRYVYDSLGKPITQNVRDTEVLIERLIGLDYSRFLRSALLAQGEFAQFLKAKPDERAGLLESLTGTAIYSELGALAHAETGRRENDLGAKEAGIQQIQLLAEDERQKLIAEIPEDEKRFEQIKQDLAQAASLLNKATNLADSLEREKRTLDAQQPLAKEVEAAAREFQQLSRHRLTIPFQGDLARLDAANTAFETASERFAHAESERSGAARKARRFLLGYRAMVKDQIERTKAMIKGAGEKITAAAERKDRAGKWLEEHRTDEHLIEGLSDLVSDLANLKGARRDLDREWDRIRNLAARLDPEKKNELPESTAELTKAKARTLVNGLTEFAQAKHAQAFGTKKSAEKEVELRADHLAKAQLVASFEDHRAGLKKGEPCPLCGGKTHPYAEGVKPSFPFKDLERLLKDAKEACRKREKEFVELDQSLAEVQANGEGLPSSISERDGIFERLGKSLKQFGLAVPSSGKEDEMKSNLQQRGAAYRTQAADAEKASRDHAAAEADRSRLASDLQGLQDNESSLTAEALPDPAPAQADAELPTWPSIPAADREWLNAKDDLTFKGATLKQCEKDKTRLKKDRDDLQSDLSAKLAGSAFTGLEDLRASRLGAEEAARIEGTEKTLNDRRHQLEADLRAAHESIDKWRTESAPEGEALTEIKERHKTLQEQHEQLIGNLRTWRNQLAQDETNRQAVAVKQKELEGDRARLEVWRRLRGLIGSHDGRLFRRYVQALSLDVLVRYANRHLLRLSERYRLRRGNGEELDLEIEDSYQAGAVRPMASLSGGESFLASLALALGLSDLAGRNVRIDSLFIDEGLSSLDSETLDLAISALETLRQDTKTVGVISHVDLLKERIATQIVVEKQSGGTSALRLASC